MKNEWEYERDPFGLIPLGFEDGGEKVIGFSFPSGLRPTKGRVIVASGTTRSYMVFLWKYMQTISMREAMDLE